MMDYEVFKNVIATRIKEFLPSVYAEFDVSIMEVPKINGMKEAMILAFESDGCRMSGPNIYLDDLYNDFKESRDLEEILKETAGKIIGCTGTQNFGRSETVKLEEYKKTKRPSLRKVFSVDYLTMFWSQTPFLIR